MEEGIYHLKPEPGEADAVLGPSGGDTWIHCHVKEVWDSHTGLWFQFCSGKKKSEMMIHLFKFSQGQEETADSCFGVRSVIPKPGCTAESPGELQKNTDAWALLQTSWFKISRAGVQKSVFYEILIDPFKAPLGARHSMMRQITLSFLTFQKVQFSSLLFYAFLSYAGNNLLIILWALKSAQ